MPGTDLDNARQALATQPGVYVERRPRANQKQLLARRPGKRHTDTRRGELLVPTSSYMVVGWAPNPGSTGRLHLAVSDTLCPSAISGERQIGVRSTTSIALAPVRRLHLRTVPLGGRV